MTMKGVPSGPRRRATIDRWIIDITTRNGNGFIKTNALVPRVIGEFLRTLQVHMRELDFEDMATLQKLDRTLRARGRERSESAQRNKSK